MRARFAVCFIFAAICFSRAESSLRQWTELGRLEGEVLAWEGEGWSDDRTIRLAGVSFPSSKSVFHVIDNPPGNRQSLSSALAAGDAVAGSNGGYFHKDFTPLGLAVSRGEIIHRFERARLLSGVLAVRHGRMELVRSGKFKSGSDVQDALQVAGLDDTRSARRTIVANDGKGQWALIATSSITLADVARLLCAKGIIGPLKIANALNLDGGSSTALQAGLPPEILIDIAALGSVRNYLTIAPRRP